MATSFEPLPGLREPFLFAGASSRARIDDVASPRCAGFTRQDTYRQYSWQIPSKNAALAFYTISAEAHDVVKSHSDVACSCSCPFKGPGWCKHIVRCLYSIVDRAATEAVVAAKESAAAGREEAAVDSRHTCAAWTVRRLVRSWRPLDECAHTWVQYTRRTMIHVDMR